jgi:hypothetical protein
MKLQRTIDLTISLVFFLQIEVPSQIKFFYFFKLSIKVHVSNSYLAILSSKKKSLHTNFMA